MTREALRTQKLTESLPVGIAIGQFKDGRKKPFFIRSGPSRRRQLESFQFEQDRNDAAEKRANKIKQEGTQVFDVDIGEWRAWCAFKARTQSTIQDVEQMWDRLHGNAHRGLKVEEAVKKYMTLRIAEGLVVKSDTWYHFKKHLLERFCAQFGHLLVTEVSTEALRTWIAGLKVGSVAKKHHRKDVNTFFKRAVREKWRYDNPCEAVVPPKIEEIEKRIISPEDAFRLLKANLFHPVAPKLALEMFGGLRCSSAERILKEHIDFAERGIFMPGAEHKSGKRKFRQGHPAVLWSWLDSATDETWEITGNMYRHGKGDAFLRANLINTGNVLRHSFVSYLLAQEKSFEKVGYLAQHKHRSTTEGYEGVAKERDAALYFALTLPAVRAANDWQQFLSNYDKHRRKPGPRNQGNRRPPDPPAGGESGPRTHELASGDTNTAGERGEIIATGQGTGF